MITTWFNFLYKAQVFKNPFLFSFSAGNPPSQYVFAWFTTFGGVSCCPWLTKSHPPSCTQGVTVLSEAKNSSSHCYTTARTQMPILARSFSCSYPPTLSFLHVTFISSRHYTSKFLSARPRLFFSESLSFPLGNLKK